MEHELDDQQIDRLHDTPLSDLELGRLVTIMLDETETMHHTALLMVAVDYLIDTGNRAGVSVLVGKYLDRTV